MYIYTQQIHIITYLLFGQIFGHFNFPTKSQEIVGGLRRLSQRLLKPPMEEPEEVQRGSSWLP